MPRPTASSTRPRFAPGGAFLLLVAVVLAYANTLSTPFLFDDAGAVVHNPTIRNLLSWEVLRPPADGSTTTGRPIVNLSFAIDYALGGLHPWNFHAGNLAIHAAATLVLFGLVRRTLLLPVLAPRFGPDSGPIALFTALLWAVHPLQTESVTCIAQRTESLCGLFYLLTLYAHLRSATPSSPAALPGTCHPLDDKFSRHPEGTPNLCHPMDDKGSGRGAGRWRGVAVGACLAGMGTKEVMVTAPLLVLLFDRTFLAGSFAGAWRARGGRLLALAATWLLLAALVIGGGGTRGVAAGFGHGVSTWHYLLTQCEALLRYLHLSIWPYPLVLDYGTFLVRSPLAVWWQGPLVLGALGVTLWALVRRPTAGFLGAWFFLVLAPSSSFVPLVAQTMAEHRMYLALAPLVLGFVLAACRLAGGSAPWLLAAAGLGLLAITMARNHDYRDAITVWRSSVAAFPAGARAHNNLAQALQDAGRREEADRTFARAIAIDPDYASARYNWGVARLAGGNLDGAVEQLQAAVRLAPGHADAHLNLGTALMRLRRPAEAVPHFEAALRLAPAADVRFNLGLALLDLDRLDEAAAQLRGALALRADLPEAHHQLGRIAERQGNTAEAVRHHLATLQLAPDHPGAHRRLGLLRARAQDFAAAAGHFRALLRLQPTDADAHANLGNTLLLQGQARAAIAAYEEALRLRPDDPRTRENLQLAREAAR